MQQQAVAREVGPDRHLGYSEQPPGISWEDRIQAAKFLRPAAIALYLPPCGWILDLYLGRKFPRTRWLPAYDPTGVFAERGRGRSQAS